MTGYLSQLPYLLYSSPPLPLESKTCGLCKVTAGPQGSKFSCKGFLRLKLRTSMCSHALILIQASPVAEEHCSSLCGRNYSAMRMTVKGAQGWRCGALIPVTTLTDQESH